MTLRLGATLSLLTLSSLAHAERPPAKGHAAAELFTNSDGGTETPGQKFLQTLSAAEREKLKKDGQVVLDSKVVSGGPMMVRAVAIFKRPKAEAYALITRPSEQSSYLPHVSESKLVGAHTAEAESNDYVVSFLFTFKYRTQHWFYPEDFRSEWQLDPAGGDGLSAQEGFWQLYTLDDETTVGEYATHLVARSAFLNFFRSLGERGGIADALIAFKKHIETAKL